MGRECDGKRAWGRCNNPRETSSPAKAVGRITQGVMGNRNAGRAGWAPLRRYKGGEARTADLNRKKREQGGLRFFLHAGHRPRAGGCPSPFEPFMKGLRAEGMERSGMTGGSKPNIFCLMSGGSPAARGRDTICRPCAAA
jgi:hypothetical protein